MAAGKNLQITEIEASGSGTIPEGCQFIGVYNAGSADAYISAVDGQGRVPAGTSKTFPAGTSTYPTMFYRAAGTTLLITYAK